MKEQIEKRISELEKMEIDLNNQYTANINAIKGALIELKALLVEPVKSDETTNKID